MGKKVRSTWDVDDPEATAIRVLLSELNQQQQAELDCLLSSAWLKPISQDVEQIVSFVSQIEKSFKSVSDQLGKYECSAIKNNLNSLKLAISILDEKINEQE